MVDMFTVFMGAYTVAFKPKEGKIFTDNTLSVSTDPGRFEWERTWQQEISTSDRNTQPPRCLCYRGVIINSKGRFGYEFKPDGTCWKVEA